MRPQLTSVVSSSGDQVKSVVTSIADGRISRAKNGWENYGEILRRVDEAKQWAIGDWLSRMDKDAKEARDKRIFDLWLACWTQQEIADEVGLTNQQVSQITADLPEVGKLNKPDKAAAEHATDFETPIYNIWKQQEKSVACSAFAFSGLSSFGRLAFS